MKRIIINEKLFGLYSDLHLGVLICNNISNDGGDCTQTLLNESIVERKRQLAGVEKLADLQIVKDWRGAYKRFNEKKNRSSIEALLHRIHNDKEISCINPLVDIYNAVSIKYLIPCGGEDIDNIEQDMELAIANGDECFIPFGCDEEEKPNEGEVIYRAGNMVVCRCFNWREADFSKLTTDTKNAVLIMECINQEGLNSLNEALIYMGDTIVKLLGGTYKKVILDKNNPVFTLDE